MSEQLCMDALPVAAPELERETAYERRLDYVLRCAEAHERDQRAGGRWWTGETLANRMREPVARVAIDMHRLRERGCLHRDALGTDPRGRAVYVWAVRGRA
jgi:hypothetical protein